MNINEYKEKALRTDYADYSDFHTGDVSARLDYASMGLVTESAKVLDIIKKSKKSLESLDKAKIKEELGDLLWYMNLTLDELNISFDELMHSSIAKIDKKHPEGDPTIYIFLKEQRKAFRLYQDSIIKKIRKLKED